MAVVAPVLAPRVAGCRLDPGGHYPLAGDCVRRAFLRLILVYAWNDWSLRTTAAWARRAGVATLSDVALLKRFRQAPAWLGYLLDQWFRARGVGPAVTSRFRLILTDGSTIQRPGSPGTTWRLHAQWNLGTGRWEALTLTDAHGAESLTRWRATGRCPLGRP